MATLGFGFAAVAGGKIKTKTFSSGSFDLEFGDFETASVTFDIRKRRSRVKDINVGLRITSSCAGELAVDLIGRDGQRVELSNPRLSCDDPDYGTGSASCAGDLTVFDDEATTPFEKSDGSAGDSYRPEDPLSRVDRSKLKGRWTVQATDTGGGADTSTLHCVELEVKYKKKRRN